MGQAQPNIHSEAERHTTTHHSPLWQGQGVRQADARRQVLARELQAPLVLRSEHVDGGPSLGRRATHAFARQAQRNGRILWPTAIGGKRHEILGTGTWLAGINGHHFGHGGRVPNCDVPPPGFRLQVRECLFYLLNENLGF